MGSYPVRANSGQPSKDVQGLLAIGSMSVDNPLSRIHHSTVYQNGKTTTLNSAEIKIVRTEVKTHLGGFVGWVINQRSIYIFNISSSNDRDQDHCQLVADSVPTAFKDLQLFMMPLGC